MNTKPLEYNYWFRLFRCYLFVQRMDNGFVKIWSENKKTLLFEQYELKYKLEGEQLSYIK